MVWGKTHAVRSDRWLWQTQNSNPRPNIRCCFHQALHHSAESASKGSSSGYCPLIGVMSLKFPLIVAIINASSAYHEINVYVDLFSPKYSGTS